MIKELLEQQVFMYTMLGLCAAGGIVKLALSLVCGRLVRASVHMADTGNRLFKLMRLKFEACYKLKITVNNVETFVDKYLVNHRFCGIFLRIWEKFSNELMLLCLCVGASGAVLGIMEECSTRLVLEHFGMGLLTGAFLYILDGLCAFDFKYAQMKVNAVDFFDNFLKARMEQEYLKEEEPQEYKQDYLEEEAHAAASRESAKEEQEEQEKPKANPEPVPAKRRPSPEMYVSPAEEMAAEKEAAKERREKRGKREVEKSIDEIEQEKIIEDILKEYL